MSLSRGGPVVVGVDGSECSQLAVDFAAREAAWHERELRIVHAFIWPLMRVPTGTAGLREQAEKWLSEAAGSAASTAPGVIVTTAVVTGAAGAVLLDAARTAGMLVVGSRGLGGFGRLLLGSVGSQAASYAPCPVVIVRDAPSPDGPVFVGVDGSAPSEAAVGFAFAEAEVRKAPLVAVHGFGGEVSDYERHLLAESLGGFAGRYPEVSLDIRFVDGEPAKALLAASEEASLLVVGSRGRGGFKGLLLGSVSQAAVQHAACPVAVLRPEEG
ncbi:universal stress protein [Phytomonospora sp. NPDC050363]|uniref:universal stress protein n=1 Tax=Phytomonospora sp. NPDC050363 TaxID=3155642 RepID=UPI0033EB4F78